VRIPIRMYTSLEGFISTPDGLVLPSGSGRGLTPELDTTKGFRPRDVHRQPSDGVEMVYEVERRAE
jgi:hypothetical protein